MLRSELEKVKSEARQIAREEIVEYARGKRDGNGDKLRALALRIDEIEKKLSAVDKALGKSTTKKK